MPSKDSGGCGHGQTVAAQPPIVTVEYVACKANASHIVRVHVRTYIYTHSVLDSVYARHVVHEIWSSLCSSLDLLLAHSSHVKLSAHQVCKERQLTKCARSVGSSSVQGVSAHQVCKECQLTKCAGSVSSPSVQGVPAHQVCKSVSSSSVQGVPAHQVCKSVSSSHAVSLAQLLVLSN